MWAINNSHVRLIKISMVIKMINIYFMEAKKIRALWNETFQRGERQYTSESARLSITALKK